MIDFKNKIIFIHIPKTGGTSIEASLRKDLQEQAFPKGLQHHKRRIIFKPRRVVGMGKNGYHSSISHINADDGEEDATQGIPAVNIKEYFSFSVIRNPWDREYSLFRFCFIDYPPLQEVKDPPTFKEYLCALQNFKETGDHRPFMEWRRKGQNQNNTREERRVHQRRKRARRPKDRQSGRLPSHIFADQWEYVSINNKIQVKQLLRFENLQEEYNRMRQRMALAPRQLPHERKGLYRDGKRGAVTYKEAYTPELIKLVGHIRQKDIEEFNYSF